MEHNVGVPMMSTRRGVAFPGGDAGSILSPRDTAGLGVKMVEYVLGGSPTGNLEHYYLDSVIIYILITNNLQRNFIFLYTTTCMALDNNSSYLIKS